MKVKDKMINLQQGDCLELMKDIPDGSVDAIICDPPYGTIKGLTLRGWDGSQEWDNIIPTEKMFFQYERILREQGALIMFSQEPYTHKLRSIDYPNLDFSYPLIWEKNIFANPFCSYKAPVSYFEDINVFRKKYDRQLKNPIRKYSKKILMYIGKSCHKINIDMGNRKLEHFLGYSSMQFNLPTDDSYNKLTSLYNLK